jgi:hypothetical protein
MSSTNRGYDRHKSDYYITPLEPIKEFLIEFEKDEKFYKPGRQSLEEIRDLLCFGENRLDR